MQSFFLINLDFRMWHREVSIEKIDLSKNENFLIQWNGIFHPIRISKPDQIHRSSLIAEFRGQSFSFFVNHFLDVRDFSLQLNICLCIFGDISNLVDFAFIDVSDRVKSEQIFHSRNPQHVSDEFCAFGADAFEKFYGSF